VEELAKYRFGGQGGKGCQEVEELDPGVEEVNGEGSFLRF